MKKISVVLTLLLLLGTMLFAEETLTKKVIMAKDLQDAEEILKNLDIDVNLKGLKPSNDDEAYFGLYLEDLSFPKAQSLDYPGNTGVLITGVVKDSPAWHYRLREDDIIMRLGNREVLNYASFNKIIKSLRAGDVVSITIFRDGKSESSDMTIGSRTPSPGKKMDGVPLPQVPRRKLSAGYGGGSWIPVWVSLDMGDINQLITRDSLGFSKFPEDYVLQQGISGKGPVGKGFFLGGQYSSYKDSKRKNVADSNYHLWMQYRTSMGGVTLDKRIPFTKNIVGSLGLMVGGASHKMEFVNTDANYNWNDMAEVLTDSNNTHFKLSKSYLIAQPRAELLVRLTSWMGLRAEGGYVYGVNLKDDWRVIGMGDEQYQVTGSPNTNYRGYTISVGPWFGF